MSTHVTNAQLFRFAKPWTESQIGLCTLSDHGLSGNPWAAFAVSTCHSVRCVWSELLFVFSPPSRSHHP